MKTKKLTPIIKRPLWSGSKISSWQKEGCEGKIGETWELSFIKDNQSTVNGVTVANAIPSSEWGSACKGEDFPLLIKFIDAEQKLSVQVHPDDEYAQAHGYGKGKTEAWYVMDCDENAGIYLGFNKNTDEDEVEKRAKDGTIEEILNFVPVKRGECYFVSSGTVHAIGKGVTVAEIQQSSDVTFRVYDYGRVDANGKPRQLHLEQALQVINYEKLCQKKQAYSKGSMRVSDSASIKILVSSNYFNLYEGYGDNEISSEQSFIALVCVEGEGTIDGICIKKGDSCFVPARCSAKICGKIKYLLTGVGI